MKTDAGSISRMASVSFAVATSVSVAYAVRLFFKDILQSLVEGGDVLRIEGIIDVLSLASVIDDPGLDQNPHIVR
jgi:hypothetical protein